MSSSNPFDFSQMFSNFSDPAAMTKQFQDMFTQFQAPSLDMSAFTESQKKNFEALAASNKAALEGTQKILSRQSEMLQSAVQGASEATKNLASTTDAGKATEAQKQLMEEAVNKAMANAKELSDMIQVTQEEASNAISERFTAAMEELQTLKV